MICLHFQFVICQEKAASFMLLRCYTCRLIIKIYYWIHLDDFMVV